jgi:poly-gamma-glutamate synthesis protein (capsule biosynthesis protein)
MDNLISSLIAFLIALVPASFISNTPTVNNQTTIIFAGDVMLGRSVMGSALDNNDNLYPFRKTSEFLKKADITMVNLENPIIKDCTRVSGGFKFCTSPDVAKGLSFSGIDIVSLSNNHSANYGQPGLIETKKYLDELGIKYVDGSNLEIIEKNSTKFGFLAFDYTISKNNLDHDLELIKTSDPQIDMLIIMPHWGEEYKDTANKFQVDTAHRMIENGADIIVGSHPHWVQNYEEYQGKPIYYSLGNFIFDQSWSEETKKGLVVKMTFDNEEIVKREEFKTYIPQKGQPIIIDESPKE